MSYNSSWPRTEALDIDDQSIPTSIAEKRSSPIHCPLFFIRAAEGPHWNDDIVAVTSIKTAKQIFHPDTFDPRKPYFNHQTAMLLKVLGEGNSCFVKRIAPTTPAAGSVPELKPHYGEFILGVKVMWNNATVYPWEHLPDGTYARATSGTPLSANTTMTLKLVSIDPTMYRDSQATLLQSPITVAASGTIGNVGYIPAGTIYPIFKVRAGSAGILGNLNGFRLWSANVGSRLPADQEIIVDQNAMIFKLQLVQKISKGVVSVVRDLFGGGTAEFGFKPNMYNFKTDRTLSMKNAIAQWNDDGVNNYSTQVLGALGGVQTYNNNINLLATALKNAEDAIISAHSGILSPLETGAIDNEHLIDFLSGKSYDGIPFQGFWVDKADINFNYNRTYYLSGGSDGDLSDDAYDAVVAAQVVISNNLASPYSDSAKYPFTDIYDSGFPIAVKYALMDWHSVRNDLKVTIGTAVAGEPKLTPDQEFNVGTDLSTRAATYAESATWGTPTCRIVIVGQSGWDPKGDYDHRVPLTFEWAVKRARYMGADNGVLKGEFKYDEYPLNKVDTLQYISSPDMTNLLKGKLWDNGVNYCQTFDEEKMFYAGMHTVYQEQRSVLTGDCYVHICCDVKRQSEKVWKMLSNDSTLSNAQFITESNKLLVKLTEGRYDDRVTITPTTVFTAEDSNNGYSWTQTVTVAGRVPKTVNQVTIVSKRLGA